MAASAGQREGGRESAPPTPGKSASEKKLQNQQEIQQLLGHQKEHPSPLQGWSSTLKPEDPQPPHVKEEAEEHWITQEGECLLGSEEADDLTKLPPTGVSVKTEDHEDKPPEFSQLHHSPNINQLSGPQEEHLRQPQGGISTLQQEDPQTSHVKEKEEEPQPPNVKEEEEELWITQEGEHLRGPEVAELTKLPLTVVSVKTEDKSPEFSQLHHSPSEENRGTEPPSSNSPQHMATKADGNHSRGSQADDLLPPLSDSDDTTSHSPKDEDRSDTQEPSSSNTDCDGDMRSHTDNKHSECSKKKTGKKRFTCSVCAKSFFYRCYLMQHMRMHTGEKPYSCSYCDKSFTIKDNMVHHLRTHTGERPYSCAVCGDAFSRVSTLKIHMRTHTGEKPFSCSCCDKRFTHRASLQSHMRTHSDGPISCSCCDKKFPRQTSMRTHMRTHSRGTYFSCSDCGKMFTKKENLVSHMRAHTEDKPISCSVCGDTFALSSSLYRHMRTHRVSSVNHGEQSYID